jgi:endonuclease YncB( thermonuclease family)
MASLVRPVVPGATSIGNVIAQAQAAANAQSAQILAAANNIARNRQRAGERAADAVVQMRLEAFQREQFNQKKLIQDEQLKLAQSANQRANRADARAGRKEPFELDLLKERVKQAPIQTAMLGSQLAGSNIRNAAAAVELEALPQRVADQNAISGYQAAQARYGHDQLDRVNESLLTLDSIWDNYISTQRGDYGMLPNQTDFGMQTTLRDLKEFLNNPGNDLSNPELRSAFNQTVRALPDNQVPAEQKAALIVPDPALEAPAGMRVSSFTRQGDGFQATFRDPAVLGEGAGMTAEEKRGLDAQIDQIEKAYKPRIEIAEEEARLAKEQLDNADEDDKEYFRDRFNQKFASVGQLKEEMAGKIEKLKVDAPVIENALFPPQPTPGDVRSQVRGFLETVPQFDQSAQKKTTELAPQPIPPSKTLPPSVRQEGEFRIFSGGLKASKINDADSFLIDTPDKGEEHFRLYFVDSPETNARFIEKIRHQAGYFGATPTQIVEAGKRAKALTQQWLSNEAFEVITRGERVMKGKRDHAMIYFPQAPVGERWLAERLVRRGLGMISTKGSKLPDGTTAVEFNKQLREMEAAAKKSKQGAWSNQK